MATQFTLNRRILVVDDDPFVADCVKGMLALDGHLVETAVSGPQALALLEKQNFDLVVTDYDMPLMRGDELALAIKARFPQLAVAMFTGYGRTMPPSGASFIPVDLVLSKPCDLRELREAVAQLLTRA